MAKVTYEIELTPENATMIDQVNRLLLGNSYTEEAPAKPAAKAETKPAAKAEKEDTSGDDEMSLADFKVVVKRAKADHDEAFVKGVLAEFTDDARQPLGRMVSSMDTGDYADAVVSLEAGPTEKAEEEEEDDGLDDDDDNSEVDAEAVKTAAKAYAKEVGRDEAKQIMNDNGAVTLTKITDCSQKQLQAMFKAFTA